MTGTLKFCLRIHLRSQLKNNLVCADINGGHDVKWNRYLVRLIVIV